MDLQGNNGKTMKIEQNPTNHKQRINSLHFYFANVWIKLFLGQSMGKHIRKMTNYITFNDEWGTTNNYRDVEERMWNWDEYGKTKVIKIINNKNMIARQSKQLATNWKMQIFWSLGIKSRDYGRAK